MGDTLMFISYAQNYEDVMLWRAFNGVGVENGFYIDVGANHPIIDSVTQAFYDRGWAGINVEPLQEHIEQLNEKRERDINLQVAASNFTGEAQLTVPNLRGLATLASSMQEKYQDEKYDAKTITVLVRTLNDIWQEYVKDKPVHFLKIDVEAHEKQVLEGLDLDHHRPWIIVVESTLPNTQIESHKDWQALITDKSYKLVYFDGLNRFYCANEHKKLGKYFKTPPNVFDSFRHYREQKMIDLLEDLKNKLKDWQLY